MPKLIILGSSNAIPHKDHENTHMVLVGETRTVLIDCVSNPILRLEQAGVDVETITDMVLTHFHPDHVAGVPLLLMNMWLMGRRKPLSIYGLHHTLDRMENLMSSYSWGEWPEFFPVAFFRLPTQEYTPVLECDEFRIVASPVRHMIPAIGLRVEFLKSKKIMAYTCDTEPCDEVARLAGGVDVLIHEAAGKIFGHSSAGQAGEMASRAEVSALYLIHYPTGRYKTGDPVAEASERFKGQVILAEDFMDIQF
jgi:ribonuclease Z